MNKSLGKSVDGTGEGQVPGLGETPPVIFGVNRQIFIQSSWRLKQRVICYQSPSRSLIYLFIIYRGERDMLFKLSIQYE